jgi:hypothetical protein
LIVAAAVARWVAGIVQGQDIPAVEDIQIDLGQLASTLGGLIRD